MKAYVLAAGYATRLYPLTRDRPKPLLEVGGAAVLTHILHRVLELEGLSEVVVVTNARFAHHFEEWARGLEVGVPVRVLNDGTRNDESKLGAIGDMAFSLGEVPLDGEDWLVVAGDNLLAFDLRPLQRGFRATGRPTLVLREVTHGAGPSRYNEVRLREDGSVARFREKPVDPETGLTAIALYFFTPEVGPLLLQYLDEGGNRDAPGHFLSWLVGRVPVAATRLEGDWFDIGSRETLEEARARFRPCPRREGSL